MWRFAIVIDQQLEAKGEAVEYVSPSRPIERRPSVCVKDAMVINFIHFFQLVYVGCNRVLLI